MLNSFGKPTNVADGYQGRMYQTKNGDLERGNDSIFVVGDCNKRQTTAVTTTNEVVELPGYIRRHPQRTEGGGAFSRGNSPARTEQWRVVLSFFVTYCLFSIYSLSWTPSRILLINSICYGWYGIASGYMVFTRNYRNWRWWGEKSSPSTTCWTPFPLYFVM